MSNHSSASIRAQLDFPVIDGDGHFIEMAPLLNDEVVSFIEEVGGTEIRDRYLRQGSGLTDTSTILAEDEHVAGAGTWSARPSWWGWPAKNTRDRATAHLPALLYERLDEFGIDFALLYPSMTISYFDWFADDLTQIRCRAANRYLASLFAPYSDRIAAGALIPMASPAMAIEELEYAVRELGAKTVVVAGYARRMIGRGDAYRLDTYGVDSAFDYDPFWAKCSELGVAPVFHSSHQHHRVTRSATSYVYNHIGGLGTAHESLSKSLFLGGVTHRFPDLRFGFLEGGVAWACVLLTEIIGHWEKRNAESIKILDPAELDVTEFMELVMKYGDDSMRESAEILRAYFSRPSGRPGELDEFSALGPTTAKQISEDFARSFYFGCEADDPMVAWAFDRRVNPNGTQLRAMFGSDISHWDVPDMTEPVAEAYELVEHGLVEMDDFRQFMFANPARLHAGMNPSFFEGTTCEREVATLLAADSDTSKVAS